MADKLKFVAEAVRRHPMSYEESNFQKKKEKNLTWDDAAEVANYAASPPRWKPPWCGEGAYLTKRFHPSASTSRARQSHVATSNKDKQIYFMLIPRCWFKMEEFRLEYPPYP